ncbi:MAG: amidophosphoribosyltransferase [Eubacterium sp.]|jgi:amidophosphoribosyltransferase|nr:amidophosphoribosyltransferase [Eubacterium sp.]
MAKLHEECGVFGIFDPKGNPANTTYYGLVALQHRGQEGCGIAVNRDREIYHYKDVGLVNDVFNEEILGKLSGRMAIGHVRYSTAGGSARENVQPLVLRYIKGTLAISHNGNITNVDEIREELEHSGAIFQTTADTEIIAYLIARERITAGSIESAVKNAMKKLKGAYSLLVMSPNKLIAARDKWGFRPLQMGKRDDAVVFASETCAFDAIDAEFVRDIAPGEIVTIEAARDGGDGYFMTEDTELCDSVPSSMCIFEHIYFARPDSTIQNEVVHECRKRAGAFLAMQAPVDADIVIGVPDSGLSAAQGYSEYSGIPIDTGFIKNKYIARTFIKPTQGAREVAVKMKLNVLKSAVQGKRVIMVDDSIVRGTTSGRIVKLLRDAGAKEVHVRISAPAFKWPCFFGTDIPDRDLLIANNHTTEETRKIINADSLEYLSLENLHNIAPNSSCGFCDACFTGNYPVEVDHLLK